jgi:hypothetical protein
MTPDQDAGSIALDIELQRLRIVRLGRLDRRLFAHQFEQTHKENRRFASLLLQIHDLSRIITGVVHAGERIAIVVAFPRAPLLALIVRLRRSWRRILLLATATASTATARSALAVTARWRRLFAASALAACVAVRWARLLPWGIAAPWPRTGARLIAFRLTPIFARRATAARRSLMLALVSSATLFSPWRSFTPRLARTVASHFPRHLATLWTRCLDAFLPRRFARWFRPRLRSPHLRRCRPQWRRRRG